VGLSGCKTVPPPLHQRSLGAGMTGCPRRMACAARQGSPPRPELRDTYHACREAQPDTLQGHLVLKCNLAEILLPSVSHSRVVQSTSPKLQCWSLQCGLVIWVSLATRSPLPSFSPLPSSLLPLSSSLSSCPPLTPLSLLSPSSQIRAGCRGSMKATPGVRGFQLSLLTMIAASAATRDAAGPFHSWYRGCRDTLTIEHLLKTNFDVLHAIPYVPQISETI